MLWPEIGHFDVCPALLMLERFQRRLAISINLLMYHTEIAIQKNGVFL